MVVLLDTPALSRVVFPPQAQLFLFEPLPPSLAVAALSSGFVSLVSTAHHAECLSRFLFGLPIPWDPSGGVLFRCGEDELILAQVCGCNVRLWRVTSAGMERRRGHGR
ncbi:hypothetical protein [Candidatus Caldatribacterium sp.]|uniref:hypothetical protein n=1 Tax=Candidatus Caldatribacterium sp. TaxID=2282143 RepID=UPI00383E6864|nr:hypothetical protein [Candidatus Caldatribacterium sp.]